MVEHSPTFLLSEYSFMSDKRKQSLYFPKRYLDEIRAESIRQDRSMSWVVQKAWEIARETVKEFPAANDFLPDDISDDGDDET